MTYAATVRAGPALSAAEVDAILALERANLAALLRETGGDFPEARRREGLARPEATVVLVHRGDALAAVADFVPDWNVPADLYVASVQVSEAARGGPALRLLLAASLQALGRLPWRRLTANVHPANHAALTLAGRVGLRRVPAPGRGSVGLAIPREVLETSPLARRLARAGAHRHPPSSGRFPMRQVTLAEVPQVLAEHFASTEARSSATDEERANADALQRMLHAIAAGEFAGLRELLAPEVDFEIAAAPRFPWVRRAHGAEAVVAAIAHNFSTVREQMPHPLAMVARGDTVMIMARETGVLAQTGEPYEVMLAHQFTFRDGRLALFRSVSSEVG